MDIRVFETKAAMADAACEKAVATLRETLARQDTAHLIAATGAAQFEFLERLVKAPGIDWSRTVFFHLDEYVGLPDSHPASFRKFLRERLSDHVHPRTFHFIEGDAPDPATEARRLGALIAQQPIDVAFVGIGENGHLAFNDPPADFETEEPYLVVQLDEACRKQQLGEGWFATLDDVPRRAISMSIQQILKTREILAIVPDTRKARAVADCLGGEVTPQHPSSILQRHARTTVFLDDNSAALLGRKA